MSKLIYCHIQDVSVELSPNLQDSASHIADVPSLARIEVSISLVEGMHPQNPPVVLQT